MLKTKLRAVFEEKLRVIANNLKLMKVSIVTVPVYTEEQDLGAECENGC